MNRLTEDDIKSCYEYHLNGGRRAGKTLVQRTCNELLQYKQIQQELGIELSVLFKALKDGIYGKVNNEITEHILAPHFSWYNREIYIFKIKRLWQNLGINKGGIRKMSFTGKMYEIKNPYSYNKTELKEILDNDNYTIYREMFEDEYEKIYLPPTENDFYDFGYGGESRIVFNSIQLKKAFKKLDCDFDIKLNEDSLYMIIGNWQEK